MSEIQRLAAGRAYREEAGCAAVVLSIRVDEANPDHHLWNNNGTWWCHYTVHLPPWQKERRRVSLGTKSLWEARARRDALLGLSGDPGGTPEGPARHHESRRETGGMEDPLRTGHTPRAVTREGSGPDGSLRDGGGR